MSRTNDCDFDVAYGNCRGSQARTSACPYSVAKSLRDDALRDAVIKVWSIVRFRLVEGWCLFAYTVHFWRAHLIDGAIQTRVVCLQMVCDHDKIAKNSFASSFSHAFKECSQETPIVSSRPYARCSPQLSPCLPVIPTSVSSIGPNPANTNSF